MTHDEYAYLAKAAKLYSDGDAVIVGTWNGEDVRTIQKTTPDRNIVVVDSFIGLADPTPKDLDESGDAHKTMHKGECNVGGLRAYHEKFQQVGMVAPPEIYPMWITPDTLRIIPGRDIGFLFIDVDHYQPTHDALEFFLPWMQNGIIVVHDYGFSRCPGIKECCDEFFSDWEIIDGTGLASHVVEKGAA